MEDFCFFVYLSEFFWLLHLFYFFIIVELVAMDAVGYGNNLGGQLCIYKYQNVIQLGEFVIRVCTSVSRVIYSPLLFETSSNLCCVIR